MTTVVVVAVMTGGCGGKNSSDKAAAEQLQKSFDKADAPIKQQVVQAGAALQAQNYAQALATMDRVVQSQPVVGGRAVMDPAQKQAIENLLKQTRQAVQQNPNLNTPDLYKTTANLTLRLHGEN